VRVDDPTYNVPGRVPIIVDNNPNLEMGVVLIEHGTKAPLKGRVRATETEDDGGLGALSRPTRPRFGESQGQGEAERHDDLNADDAGEDPEQNDGQ
jgi:hypothetical protein